MKYYSVNLSKDENGTMWNTLLQHIIERSNFFETTVKQGISWSYSEIERILEKNTAQNVEELKKVLLQDKTNFHKSITGIIPDYNRELRPHFHSYYYTKKAFNPMTIANALFGIERYKLTADLKKYIMDNFSSYDDVVFNSNFSNDGIQLCAPAFYEDDVALLWTSEPEEDEMDFAYIALTEEEKTTLENKGIEFEKDTLDFDFSKDKLTQAVYTETNLFE